MITPTIWTIVEEPEDPVVGVVGRREPGEVDPGPGDRERAQREAEQARLDVVLGDEVRQLVGGDAEGDDEREVEEQLERRRRAVGLRRVAPVHPGASMRQRRPACRTRITRTPPSGVCRVGWTWT